MINESPVHTRTRTALRRHVGTVLFIAIFVIGILIGRSNVGGVLGAETSNTVSSTIKNQTAVQPLPKDINFKQFWEIWNKIQEKSVKRPIDEHKLFYGALQGMVSALGDPYSVYFVPEIATQFQEELQGSFSGIGAEVGSKDGRVVVIAPLPDAPAERAGVKAGDFILSINGESTAALTVDQAVKKIRGPSGTLVTLSVEREGAKEPIKLEIKREKIELKSVTNQMLPGGIQLIKLSSFNEQTTPQFEEAVQAALKNHVKGIILDLRNNPGGFFETAITVSSEWLDEGQIVVSQRGVDKSKREDFVAHGLHRLRGIPTVVLVNGGSASASEIVAGALHDTNKAKVVGQKSFGKGSVQEYEELPDGSALKLTIALWYTPNDISINEHGIKPDVIIEEKSGATSTEPLSFADKKDVLKDLFVQRALQVLQNAQ